MNKLAALFLMAGIVLCCYLAGHLFSSKESKPNTFSATFFQGALILFTATFFVALPCIFIGTTFTFFTFLLLGVVLVLCVIACIRSYKNMALQLRNGFTSVAWIFLPVLVLILVQMYVATVYMHVDEDDAFFVATAATSVHTDSLFAYNGYTGAPMTELPARYALSPFYLIYGVLSLLSGIPSAVVAHTILPPLLLALAYCIYYQWARRLFPNEQKKQALFLFFLCLIQIWGHSSVYTSSTFLLIRLWQGKAFLAGALLPGLLLILYDMYSKVRRNSHNALPFNSDMTQSSGFLWLFMAICSCCLASSMGVVLSALMVGLGALMILWAQRKPKTFVKIIACCIPCIIIGIVYLILRGEGLN